LEKKKKGRENKRISIGEKIKAILMGKPGMKREESKSRKRPFSGVLNDFC